MRPGEERVDARNVHPMAPSMHASEHLVPKCRNADPVVGTFRLYSIVLGCDRTKKIPRPSRGIPHYIALHMGRGQAYQEIKVAPPRRTTHDPGVWNETMVLPCYPVNRQTGVLIGQL